VRRCGDLLIQNCSMDFKESEWGEGVVLRSKSRSVFLNGFMHMFE
jgi:hypothetical protein